MSTACGAPPILPRQRLRAAARRPPHAKLDAVGRLALSPATPPPLYDVPNASNSNRPPTGRSGRAIGIAQLAAALLAALLLGVACGGGEENGERVRKAVAAWTATGLDDLAGRMAGFVAGEIEAPPQAIETALAESVAHNLNWAIVDTREVSGGIRAEVQLEAPFDVQLGGAARTYSLSVAYNLLVSGDSVEEAILIIDSLDLVSASPPPATGLPAVAVHGTDANAPA